MKSISPIIFIFLVCSSALGQGMYTAAAIPDSLKKNMYAVIREQHTAFTIIDRAHSKYNYRSAITILKSKGSAYAQLSVYYDKLSKITSLKATVYDANGLVIKKTKASDFIDQSSISGFSLFEDSREKWLDLRQTTYPYTIEFEYEVQKDFLYSIPNFSLYTDDEVSIQGISYKLIFPPDLKPRYKTYQLEEPKHSILSPNLESFTWAYQNIIPKRFESLAPSPDSYIPHILAAPVEFEHSGYAGRMDSWHELGKWQSVLNQGRDNLLPETKAAVKELVKGIDNDREKVRALYKFLQNKTRYVSIQRGIGGFQPFDAATVDKLSYGDCKALSNYMVSILKEVGIKGYYTQIYGGERDRPVPKDFTIDYFNHIIVAVPLQKDTVWLECTNQQNPFGFLGSFTGNRYALMVTDDGGILVKTPSYSQSQNQQIRSAQVTLDENGNAQAKVSTLYAGLQIENDGLDYYLNKPADDQKKWVQKNIHIPTFDISHYSLKMIDEERPSIQLDLNLQLNRFGSVSGKRVFLTPNLMNRSTFIPEKLEERRNKIVRAMAFQDIDTIMYKLPDNVYPEFVPEAQKFSSAFGDYEVSFKLDEKGLLYIRKLKMNKGEFPASAYQELVEFYKNINKADNIKVVLLNKT